MLGGRTLHWNATCLRFSENDFRERSVNGVEEDWPLTYRELAPFYSHVERVIGLCGTRENLAALPDGEYVSPPLNMRCSEMLARKACRKLGLLMMCHRRLGDDFTAGFTKVIHLILLVIRLHLSGAESR